MSKLQSKYKPHRLKKTDGRSGHGAGTASERLCRLDTKRIRGFYGVKPQDSYKKT